MEIEETANNSPGNLEDSQAVHIVEASLGTLGEMVEHYDSLLARGMREHPHFERLKARLNSGELNPEEQYSDVIERPGRIASKIFRRLGLAKQNH